MAYEHDGTSGSYLSGAAGALAANANTWTIMAWVRPDVVSSYRNLWYVDTMAIQITPSGQWEFYDGATGHAFGAATAGVWQHVCVSRSSATAAVGYVDGVATSLTPASSSMSGSQYIGTWDATADWFDGQLAHVKAWSSALSAAEVVREMATIRPSALQNVRSWYPMLRDSAVSDLGRDHSSQGRTLSVTGTPTASGDLPGISWGVGVLLLPVPSTGGASEQGAATLAGVGTLAAAGVRERGAAATLAGAGTLAAAPARARSGASALSGTGSLTADPLRGRTGSLALAGAGTLTAAGRRGRAGSAALAGAGSLAASATRLRAALAALGGVGTLAATGELLGALTGAASLAGIGTLTASPARARSGSLALAGTGTLTASARRTRIAASGLVGTGSLSATAARMRPASAALTGSGNLAASAWRRRHASAGLTGVGLLAAAGVIEGLPAITLRYPLRAVLASDGRHRAVLGSVASRAVLTHDGRLTAEIED